MNRILSARLYFNSLTVQEHDGKVRSIAKTTGAGIQQREALERAIAAVKRGIDLAAVKLDLTSAGFSVCLKEIDENQKNFLVGLGPGGWNDYYYGGLVPDDVVIRCPRCKQQAILRNVHYSETGYLEGLVICGHCPLSSNYDLLYSNAVGPKDRKKVLYWPEAAYYQWQIRGHTLWAKDEKYARVLLAYLSSKDRDEHAYGSYRRVLQKLPSWATSAKMRDDVVRAMRKTLGG